MCGPLAAVAAFATIAGTMMSAQGQQEARQAETDAATANMNRQSAYQDQANALFKNSLSQATADNINATAASKTAQRAASLVPVPTSDEAALTPAQTTGASKATRNAIVGGAKNADTDLTNQGNARAALGGMNDAFKSLAEKTQPDADRINILG